MDPLHKSISSLRWYILCNAVSEIHLYRVQSDTEKSRRIKHLIFQNGIPHRNYLQVRITNFHRAICSTQKLFCYQNNYSNIVTDHSIAVDVTDSYLMENG